MLDYIFVLGYKFVLDCKFYIILVVATDTVSVRPTLLFVTALAGLLYSFLDLKF